MLNRSKAGKKITPVNSKNIRRSFFLAPFWHRWSYFSIINLSVFHLADKCFTITNLINLQIILFLHLDTTLSCDNKSIVYAPISRLRRSFADIRKMPTSKAIKKETTSKLAVSFFIALIGALFIAFAYITR